MSTITIGEITIHYTIKKMHRKSLSMAIKEDNEIEIKSPTFMPEFMVKRFIHKNESWILKQLERRKQIKQHSLFPEFQTGVNIPFFGKEFPLTISTSELAKSPRIYFIKDSFQIITNPNLTEKQKQKEIKKLFKNWYFDNMKEKLEERVQYWAEKMNLTYNTIRIKDVKGHWGSCSSKKNLNFNYRIAMLPMEGIDYIIIHELSHLREMNHSARFWTIVHEFMPDYKKVRSDLKKKAIEID